MFVRALLSPGALAQAVMLGLCFDTPDGTGGAPAAGADPAAAAPAGGAPAGGAFPDGGADPGAGDLDAAAAAPADDDRDELPDDDDVVDHLPEPQVRTRLRRTQRYAQRLRPIAERFRDPATGRFMEPEQVDELVTHARYFREVDQILQADPEAVRALNAARERLARGGGPGAAAAAPAETPFDEAAFAATWPYEVDSDQGKRFYQLQLQMAKDRHEDRQFIRRLEGQLRGVERSDQQRTLQQLEGQWKDATVAAAKEVDPAYRQMFVGAVKAEFELLRVQGRLTQANVKQVIDRHLAPIRKTKKGSSRDAAARASATVVGNAGLPRTPRPGTMQPAGGQPEPKRETLKDASKSFLARYAR